MSETPGFRQQRAQFDIAFSDLLQVTATLYMLKVYDDASADPLSLCVSLWMDLHFIAAHFH